MTTVPDAVRDRARWFGAVLRLLTAHRSPTVLVIDDVPGADGTTLEWLTWVQHRPLALLVIAVARPGTIMAGAHELALGPLGDDAIAALVDVDGDTVRAAEVRARTGGNPLFALALAAHPEGELPVSRQQAVASTLDRLDMATGDLVRAGAVLDVVLDVDLLADVLRLPAIDVVERLERAAAAGLLVERGPGFEFRNPLVREALAATSGAARCAFLHREAARVLHDRPNPAPSRCTPDSAERPPSPPRPSRAPRCRSIARISRPPRSSCAPRSMPSRPPTLTPHSLAS